MTATAPPGRTGPLQWLELRIPPPVVALAIGGAMWGVSTAGPALALPSTFRNAAAALLALTGALFDLLGFAAFWRSRTTINPLRPQKTTALVTGGVYRITRNPMYVGLVFFLLSWALMVGSVWALAGPVFFIAYVTRFQIRPEERVLVAMFGEEYAAYASRVRRWL